jgi:hypothetical protein
MTSIFSLLPGVIIFFISSSFEGDTREGVSFISFHGYNKCIELKNSEVRVVLGPDLGGRVLAYELNGLNVIYHNPQFDGMLYKPGEPAIDPDGGRSDIGPEFIVPEHNDLFLGKWEGEITGIREARMISRKDTSTGVQLIRSFRLDKKGSRLSYTQTIVNISKSTKHYCHWSRTFVKGGGISLTPLNPRSRFPKGYMIYGPGSVMDYKPADESFIRTRNGILEITGPTRRPKFVMDVKEGWLAYITRDDQLFVKKFAVYPDRIYGEMSAANVSIWYNKEEMCEIEPIGPMETIRPGKKVSYKETWHLFNYKYPEDKLPDHGKLLPLIREL